jgi:hypothetical protein
MLEIDPVENRVYFCGKRLENTSSIMPLVLILGVIIYETEGV